MLLCVICDKTYNYGICTVPCFFSRNNVGLLVLWAAAAIVSKIDSDKFFKI